MEELKIAKDRLLNIYGKLVEGKTIHVIPTKNIPQGIAAALSFNPEEKVSVNKVNMIHAIENITAGQITYAVRNTRMDNFTLKKGDIIGLDDKKILAKGNSIVDCAKKLISALKEDYHAVINLYYGQDVKEEDAVKIQEEIQAEYPDFAVELFAGGQAVYYFIVSLE